MTTYKIEMYYEKNKQKHKLYETEKAYNYWLGFHEESMAYHNKSFFGPSHGLAGFIDGKVVKVCGIVPEKISKQFEKNNTQEA